MSCAKGNQKQNGSLQAMRSKQKGKFTALGEVKRREQKIRLEESARADHKRSC